LLPFKNRYSAETFLQPGNRSFERALSQIKGESYMKRMAAILAIVLGCSAMTLAQEKSEPAGSQGTEMSGVLCNAKCVKQDAGKAACDSGCTANGHEVVFIDDEGKVTKVANPGMAKGKMGKKVKVRGEMKKDKDTMEIYNISLTAG